MKRMTVIIITVIILALAITGAYLLLPGSTQRPITILGAGASFPYPLISKWAQEYERVTDGIVKIDYQSIGSGGGIKQITERTVDFGASDAPMKPEEREKAPGMLHIPETLGGAVLAYNLPGLKGRLKLTGDIIANIYLGKIERWNDPRIKEVNPYLKLPNHKIIVVKRADSSGTSFIFTSYLSSISREWKARVGKGKIFSFPPEVGDRGLTGKGNEGVTAVIKQNPYSIGYIELTYALQNNITFALIMNRAGNFIDATLRTISKAATGISLPRGDESWYNVSIVDAPGEDSYPIASFTYLLVYKDLSYMGQKKAKALKEFLTWAVTDGQRYAPPLGYAPLPKKVVQRDLETIGMITW